MPIKKIGILTGGGDCPGLNAVIRAITRVSIAEHDWEVFGIFDGYEGAVEGRGKNLDYDDVSNIISLGGTILGTSNKANPFKYTISDKKIGDQSDRLVKNLESWKIDALFCIGGDGTLTIANQLRGKYPHIIGVPKTIDNDLEATDQAFGFDTACNFVVEAIDRIRTTGDSHHRAMVIEVMGRYAGWIALKGGLAGGGDIILIPEFPFEFEKIADAIGARQRRKKKASIIIVSEGAHPKGRGYVVKREIADSPDPIRLGGIGQVVADEIEKRIGVEARVTVLGHLQRGGSPSFYDRLLATGYGTKAVQLAAKNDFGKMVALKGNEVVAVDLARAIAELKLVTLKDSLVAAAGLMNTSLGI